MKRFLACLIAIMLIIVPLSLNIITVSGEYQTVYEYSDDSNGNWSWEDGEEFDYGDSDDYYYDDDDADYYYNENEDNEDYEDREEYDYGDSDEYYYDDDDADYYYNENEDNGDYEDGENYDYGDGDEYYYDDDNADYYYNENEDNEEYDYENIKNYKDWGSTYQTVTPYYDVPYSHWASGYIGELSEMNIINGYEDGSFRPEDSVTKGEFLKLIFSALNIELKDKISIPYKDIKDHWAEQYVNTAFQMDILDNISNSNIEFGIDNPITRLEMVAIIGRIMDADGSDEPLAFTDSEDIPAWAKRDVGVAVELGIIVGMDDGAFLPNLDMTRAEAATIVWRIFRIS